MLVYAAISAKRSDDDRLSRHYDFKLVNFDCSTLLHSERHMRSCTSGRPKCLAKSFSSAIPLKN